MMEKTKFPFGSEEDFQQFRAEEEEKKVTLTMADMFPTDQPESGSHIMEALGCQQAEFSIPGTTNRLEVLIFRAFEFGGRVSFSATTYPYQAGNPQAKHKEQTGHVMLYFLAESPHQANSLEEVLAEFVADVEDELYLRLPAEFIQDVQEKNQELVSAMQNATKLSYTPPVVTRAGRAEPLVPEDRSNLVWTAESEGATLGDEFDDLYENYDPNYCEQCGSYSTDGVSGTFIPGGGKYADSVIFTPPQGCFSIGDYEGAATEERDRILDELASIDHPDVAGFADLLRQAR